MRSSLYYSIADDVAIVLVERAIDYYVFWNCPVQQPQNHLLDSITKSMGTIK